MKRLSIFLVLASLFLPAALRAGGTPEAATNDASDLRLSALVRQPAGALFRVSHIGGKNSMGDPESHFQALPDFKNVTFDTSNNRMLANVGPQGSLLSVTSYRESYSTLTPGWPGVWTCKDNSTTGPYSFGVVIGGEKIKLGDNQNDYETTVLDNLIPQTVITQPGKPFGFRLLTFAPMTADGSQRLGAVVYALEISNTGTAPLDCHVTVPSLNTGNGINSWAHADSQSSCDVTLIGMPYADAVNLVIPPGSARWVPALLYVVGENAPEIIASHPLDWWLAQTLQHYRGVMGRLETPDQPFLAQFYERQLMQCLQSIAMAPSGNLAGSNWGSAPATRMIWTKDCYYSYLGLMQADPAMAEKMIAWFDAHGVRPSGNHTSINQKTAGPAGGVNHSISLSVAAPVLATMHYEATSDKELFARHPEWKTRWAGIIDGILGSRKYDNVYIFPTQYISDGPVKGDFHTGSNIVFWKALTGYARLLKEVWNDAPAAAKYEQAAADLKAALLKHNVIDAPTGKCLIEASKHNTAAEPRIESDGEESDTTLAAAYGFMDLDDPLYASTMKFAVSEANIAYRPALNSISWETGIPSTSPGYNKGVAAALTQEECWGANGHYSEFRRIADADGSVWWWSYGNDKHPEPAKPIRGYANIGKAGWTSGVYTTLYRNRMIGVTYDAPARRLRFAPMAVLGRFTWREMPLGNHRFNLAFDPTSAVSVNNPTSGVLHAEITVPKGNWTRDGQPVKGEELNHLGTPSLLIKMDLQPGETADLRPRK